MIDLDQTRQFLTRLDASADAFTFQTFDDISDRRSMLRVLHGRLNDVSNELVDLNNRGAGVFVTINRTNGRGRKSEDIVAVRALFVDLDGAPLQPVLDEAIAPHIVVESSPGKYHAYWLIDEMEPFHFRASQLTLAERYHGDRAVSDLPRVMRLPGFMHRKKGPFLTKIVRINDRERYPGRLLVAADADNDEHISAPKKPATDLDLWIAHCALQIIPVSLDWHQRNYVGMATWRGCDGDEYGFESWSDWLRRSGRFDEYQARRQWRAYFRSKPTRLGIGTLVFLARQMQPDWYQKLMSDLDGE